MTGLYDPSFIIKLISEMSYPGYVVYILLLWVFSFFILGITGCLIKDFFTNKKYETKPWALDIILGILFHTLCFILLSFFHRLLSFIPPYWEFFPSLLVLLFALFFKKNLFISSLKATVSPLSLIYFFLFFLSVFVHGYWGAFDILLPSSDPAIITSFTDVYRQHGYITNYFSLSNPNPMTYPIMIGILTISTLNPLMPTASAINLWPNITVTLSFFLVFELIYAQKKIGRLRKFIGLAIILLLLRLLVFCFDVRMGFFYMEGASKTSLHFLVLIALLATLELGSKNILPRAISFWSFLFWFATGVICLVNPVNFYLSCTLSVFGLVYHFMQKNSRTLWYGVGIAAASISFVLVLFQEPMLLNTKTGKKVICATFGDQVPVCQVHEKEVQKKMEETGKQSSFLPLFIKNPLFFLFPTIQGIFLGMFGGYLLVVFGILAGLLTLKGLSPTTSLKSEPLKKILWPSIFFFLCFYLVLSFFALVQVYFFSQHPAQNVRAILSSYTSVAYLNIFIPLVLLSAFGLPLYWIAFKGKNMLESAKLNTVVLCAVIAVYLSVALDNMRPIVACRKQRAGNVPLAYGKHSTDLASLYSALNSRIPDNARLISGSWYYYNGYEHWVFVDSISHGYEIYSHTSPIFSYSAYLPPEITDIKGHHDKLCGSQACDYLKKYDVGWMIDFARRSRMCEKSISNYIEDIGCFQINESIHSFERKFTAKIFRKVK